MQTNSKITAYLYDKDKNVLIPWDGITEISDDMVELSEEEMEQVRLLIEPMSFSITFENSSFEDSPSEKADEEPKQKPNPIYIPKHIAHRKKRGR
jgi:hypothetical protein